VILLPQFVLLDDNPSNEFREHLQFLDPLNLNGLNLLKPRAIKSIIGTGILIRLNYINEKNYY